MDMMSEHEWIKHIKKLEKMFRQSYPNGTSKEFITWLCNTYGYAVDGD